MRGEPDGRSSSDVRGPGERQLRAAVRKRAERRRAAESERAERRRAAESERAQRRRAAERERAERRQAAERERAPAQRAQNGGALTHLRARTDDPKPYDDDWGWWIEFRLGRIEAQIKWLVALAAATLVAEVFRVALAALGLP